MKELTREQKLEAYIYCYLEILLAEERNQSVFCCILLSNYKKFSIYSRFDNLEAHCKFYFPEFMKYKPKELDACGGFFNDYDYESRKKILTKIINTL